MNKDLSRRHSLIEKYKHEQGVRILDRDTSVIFSTKYSLPQAEMLISRHML